MTAWLITREEHAPRRKIPTRERVVAVLSRRWSSESIQRIVEVLHNIESYTLSEQAGYANDRHFDPYPAEFARIRGVRYLGQMTCGHNPYLFARLVDKLTILGTPGHEDVTWVKRPLPEPLRDRIQRRPAEK